MLKNENTYGVKKRFAFIEDAIATASPSVILDVGCGAGTYLTYPIAARFPNINVVGCDTDRISIDFAQKSYLLPNIEFKLFDNLPADARFDMVIASEVIEHVEDPLSFLLTLKSKLNPGGVLVVTLPNGYGPFEIMSFMETILSMFGIPSLLRNLFGKKNELFIGSKDTLAASPHINFFSFSMISTLFTASGFKVEKYCPRSFLSGWGFDRLLTHPNILSWNVKICESLPPCMSSDWMFVLSQATPLPYPGYRRGLYARLRRYLNEHQLQRQSLGK
jgi:2-polyprenyl-3-methyl-5-hydroxy-6-metoxy-1,4-benzoquinol methylase